LRTNKITNYLQYKKKAASKKEPSFVQQQIICHQSFSNGKIRNQKSVPAYKSTDGFTGFPLTRGLTFWKPVFYSLVI
jgi:hypothetical protein